MTHENFIITRNCKNCGDQSLLLFYRDGPRYRCKVCQIKNEKEYVQRNKEVVAAKQKARRDARRLKVLCHYSDSEVPFCDCCKEDTLKFLVIDHKYGGGVQHRKNVGKNIYNWIVDKGFPPMFRVLCHNCNACYGTYGTCPHKTGNADSNPPALSALEPTGKV